jgi:hypothetical protein
MQLRPQAGPPRFPRAGGAPRAPRARPPHWLRSGASRVSRSGSERGGEQATGLFPQFAIGMGKQREQCRRGLAAQIARARKGASGRRDAVDAPGRLVPGVGGIQVTEPEVGPIGDVDRAVGTALQVDRPEGAIFARDQGELYRPFGTSTCRAGGRLACTRFVIAMPTTTWPSRSGSDAPFVEQKRLREALAVALVRHVFEESKEKGIHGGAVLGPVFHVGAALHVVQPARRSRIGAGERATHPVEFEAERVAPAFGEYLEGSSIPDGSARCPDRVAGSPGSPAWWCSRSPHRSSRPVPSAGWRRASACPRARIRSGELRGRRPGTSSPLRSG